MRGGGAGGGEVRQVKYQSMRIDDLVAADYNPRAISGPALNGLKRSLDRFGLVQPIVVNAATNTIVGRHQRVRALLEQGETEVQVALVELSPAEERALNVALNSPHIAGEFTDDLQPLLEQIRAESPTLMDELLLEHLALPEIIPSEAEPVDLSPNEEMKVCPHCGGDLGD